MNSELALRHTTLLLGLALLTVHRSPLTAQAADLARERSDYASWLATAPFSPYAAIALQPIGTGITLGPADADIPLAGITASRIVEERGTIALDEAGRKRALPKNRAVPLGNYQLMVTGSAGRTQVIVYGSPKGAKAPEYYPVSQSLSFISSLDAPERRGAFRTLGADGVETEANEAGFVTLPLTSGKVRLRVYRMGSANDDEAELQVFFRDSTNGKGSYPAGRFLTLDPVGPGRYRIDLNRARNPFCAYSTIFPCPPPWPGNTIPVAIAAGERYQAKP